MAHQPGRPGTYHAYREMVVPAGPNWVEEHLRRLIAAGIQPHFQLTCMPDLETVERLVRRGHYKGPLNLTWVGIGGGFDGPNPNNFMEFIRRAPDGSTVTLETLMRNVLPVNVMAMCLGMHVALRQRGHALRPARRQDDFGPADRADRPRSPGSSAARSRPARKRAKSTRSASSTTASRRRWPSSAWRRTASRAGARCPTDTRHDR